MIRADEAKSAAGDFLAAALLDEGWADALQRFADAAEAGGASLVRVQAGRAIAQISSTGWSAAEAEIMAGRTPPSRLRFYPNHAFGHGFRADHEVWSSAELRRDPYYQEFLRPRGVLFHAKVRLYAAPNDRVSLTLKRHAALGPYEPRDIAVLDSLVADLHAAFRIARCVLDAEASGVVQVVHQRGDPVFELDASGRVLRAHGNEGEHSGLLVRNGRLVAVDRLAQTRLDRAVAAAVAPPQRPGLVTIADKIRGRTFLQIVPITGGARDVFLATAAVVVVTQPDRPRSGPLPDIIRQAFDLTVREAQIASLLAGGSSLSSIAESLQLGIGTVRNHLKSIFAKTDTRRQGELIAVLRTLQP